MKKILISFLLIILCAAGLEARTYALCTAISTYNRPGLCQLGQSTKDAKAFSLMLKKRAKDVSLITGQNATEAKIKSTLGKIASAAKPDDQIIFMFSGHGGKNFFCAYDKNMSYYDLLAILSKSRCKNILVLIDACNSGSLANAVTNLKKDGLWKANIASIVSSRLVENSMENGLVGAGLLAKGVMKGMRGKADANGDRQLTIRELFKYVYNDVTVHAKKMNHSQHPQLIAPAAMQDYVIWSWQ